MASMALPCNSRQCMQMIAATVAHRMRTRAVGAVRVENIGIEQPPHPLVIATTVDAIT